MCIVQDVWTVTSPVAVGRSTNGSPQLGRAKAGCTRGTVGPSHDGELTRAIVGAGH